MRSPRVRTLCALIAALGLVAVVVLLLKPIDASFEEDPLLRLQGFDRPPGSLPTRVNCGNLPASLKGTSAAASLYTIARDEACHREGYRRLVAAIAASSAVVVLSLVVVVAAQGTNGPVATPRARPLPRQARKERAEQPSGPEKPEGGGAGIERTEADTAPSDEPAAEGTATDATGDDGAPAVEPEQAAGQPERERGAYGLGGPEAPTRSKRARKRPAEAPAVTPGDADR